MSLFKTKINPAVKEILARPFVEEYYDKVGEFKYSDFTEEDRKILNAEWQPGGSEDWVKDINGRRVWMIVTNG